MADTSIDADSSTSSVKVSSTASGGSLVTSGSRTLTMIDAEARRPWELVTS